MYFGFGSQHVGEASADFREALVENYRYWKDFFYSIIIYTMDKIEYQILNFMTLNPGGLAARELQSLVRPKISQPTLWRRLDKLRATGRVRKVGRGRATRYLPQGSRQAITDLRSKILHIEVGRKLIRQPTLLVKARQRLQRMYQSTPYSQSYLECWDDLLSGPLEGVLQVLGAENEEAKALRHVSPFAGILSEKERRKALRKQGLSR